MWDFHDRDFSATHGRFPHLGAGGLVRPLLAAWLLSVIGAVLLPVLAVGAAAALPLRWRRRRTAPDGPAMVIDGTYEVIEPGR